MTRASNGGEALLHRLVVESAPSGLLALDERGAVLLANAQAGRLLGREAETLIGRPITEFLPDFQLGPAVSGEGAPAPAMGERGLLRGRGELEVLGRSADGSALLLEASLASVPHEGRSVTVLSLNDPRARRRVEQRFHAVVEAAPSGILMVDPEGRLTLVNEEIERLFGWSREELLGRPIELLVPEHFRERHPSQRRAFSRHPEARPMGAGRELFGLRRDGSEVPVEIGLRPVPSEDGLFVIASVVDITERKRAEDRLRESEERVRSLIEGVADHALVMIDADSRIEVWNAGAEALTGRGAPEVLGRDIGLLDPPGAAGGSGLGPAVRRAAQAGKHEFELPLMRADGVQFLAHGVATSLEGGARAADSGSQGCAIVFRDVTAERALEERLRQSQKSEAIGTLASGIAHDFNNVLLAIRGYAELALEDRHDPGSYVASLHQVLAGADRGARLVERILSFSRGDETKLAPISVRHAIRETVELLRASLPAGVRLRLDLDEATPDLMGDPTQLQQAVMNLATNAAQANGEGGGLVEISAGPVELDAEGAGAHPELSPGLHVRIAVRDEGPGVPEELRDRIFDPFFTTKPTGRGTGLGLSVVRSVARAHGGSAEVRAAPGGGALFELLLPAVTETAAGADRDEAPGHETAEPGRPRILYVEDERELAELARKQLQRLDYDVSVQDSSLAALAVFRRDPQAWDAVITDNSMPHLSGLELATELLRIRPELPILMVSGLATTLQEEALRRRGIREILRKPHRRDELAQAVARLLSRDGSD